MTDAPQLAQDSGDLCAVMVVVLTGLALAGWWVERRARRRRELEILPPPIDGRDHNAESIAEWQRKRDAIARTE